jgi:DNA repair exonuclease SbcCD nuclease subunit|tara:strand:+ start:6488 stop:7600 length:1113 start_codon:yes stop_codon:yes gene_type:complete
MINQEILDKPVKRIWILGDMHLGVRSSSLEWLDMMKDFYDNQFIPTLLENYQDGDILVQVGDAFDNRQSINIRVLHYAIDLFERLGKILPVHVIAGNHDIWAKKSNEVTSIDTLKWIPNVAIYKESKTFNWGGKEVLLMPWRRDTDHEKETLAEFPNSNIVFCHSEVRGIKLNKKVDNFHGVEASTYDRFDAVYSGHIHYRQKRGRLRMVGTPYELTRSDMDNTKGFDMVDLEDMSETFYENTISPKFVKFYLTQLYDVKLGEFKDAIRNNYVDLYIPSNIATTSALSRLINKVQSISRKIDPNIYEQDTFLDKDMYDMDEIEDLYKNYNILHLCNMYVDNLGHSSDVKDQIKARLRKLHDFCAYNYEID